uniref:Uncharacterized protein n=1 Tax=Physcomitrium patens TaxID=3218 RepID=A0A2K1J7P0_PHYPA|nr:hypothetical protein PHYPA_020652 [Physcomitrium patens]
MGISIMEDIKITRGPTWHGALIPQLMNERVFISKILEPSKNG